MTALGSVLSDALACQSGCCPGGHGGGDRRRVFADRQRDRAAGPAGVPDPDRSYGYVDDRCGLLLDSTIQEVLGADDVVRPYSGAVCQYVLSRESGPDVGAGAPPMTIDVTFSWFETGSLDRERALATERGAQITDTVVERHQAFLARRATTGAACSATAAAGPGVLSWWVQFRGQTTGDPCTGRREAAVPHAVVGPVTMTVRMSLHELLRCTVAGIAVLAAAVLGRTGHSRDPGHHPVAVSAAATATASPTPT